MNVFIRAIVRIINIHYLTIRLRARDFYAVIVDSLVESEVKPNMEYSTKNLIFKQFF